MKQHWVAVGILTLITSLQPLKAAVIYTEDFLNDTGVDASFSTYGWLAYHGTSATAYNPNSTSSANPIVSLGQGAGTANGFARMASGIGVGEPNLLFTNDIQLTPTSIASIESVSFSMRNQSTAPYVRLAIQVESLWYVTTSEYNSVAATWTSLNVDFSTASWNTLSFTPGSTLSMGTSALLPTSGTITGVGIFIENRPASAYISLDNVVVNAVPEPGSIASLAIAGVLLGGLVARRSRA
jgi:hypothetical protein